MKCTAVLQSNGNMNLPASIVRDLGDAPAVSMRVSAGGLDVAVVATLTRWKLRGWLMFPAEARALCPSRGALEVDVEPVASPVPTSERAIVPLGGVVRFESVVRRHDGLLVSVPLAWYRGMRRAGWDRAVDVVVRRGSDETSFSRELSVRDDGATVVLALPKARCCILEPGDMVVVELRRPESSGDPWAFPKEEWPAWSEARRESELQRLLRAYRQYGFPWHDVRSRVEKDALASVAKAKVVLDGDAITSVSHVGQTTCLAAHPERLRARYWKGPSVVEAFEDDGRLLRALRFQLDHGDPVSPHRLLRALSALAHGPLNFPPALARWLVDEYAPQDGTVIDPCSGYGGRLLGALASRKNVTYVGADVEPDASAGNVELARLMGATARLRQAARAVEDAEEWPKADLALVGPPYYDRETYGDASRKRLAAYPTFSSWVEGFLWTLVEKTMTAAPRAVFNVAVIRDGKTVYDLPSDLMRLGERAGAKIERVLTWRTAKFNVARSESLIVLAR